MATARSWNDPPECVLHNVSWALYSATLWELYLHGSRSIRINFDRGTMELMPVWHNRAFIAKSVARLLETYVLELRIPCVGLGNVTCRSEDLEKGLEPDACYYITTPGPPEDVDELDLSIHAPPEIAIEVDIAHSLVPRQPIYAALGMPEIWHFRGTELTPIWLAPQGGYEARARSLALPDLDFAVFNRFVNQALADQSAAVLAFADWLRAR